MRSAVPGPHTHLVTRRVTSSALIGRGEELTAALDAATSVHSGQARIMLIAGDAGIGKTRLVTEVCSRAVAVRDGRVAILLPRQDQK